MKNFTKLALVATALSLISTAVSAQEFRWNFANAYPASEYHSVAMSKFADEMRSISSGELDITVHHAGSLFPNTEIVDATRNGLVEMGSQLVGNLSRENRLFELDSVPFLVSSYADAKILWEVQRESIGDLLLESGLRMIYLAPWPSQGFLFQREVNALEDIRGVPMRAYNPMTVRLAEVMGASPIQVQMTETSQALATGLIQAVHVAPNSGALYALNEYTTHYYKTDAWVPMHVFFVREEAFQELPQEWQDKALEIGRELENESWVISEKVVTEGEQTLAERGMIVAKPGDQLTAEFSKVGQTLLEEWRAAADDRANAVLDEYLERMKGQ